MVITEGQAHDCRSVANISYFVGFLTKKSQCSHHLDPHPSTIIFWEGKVVVGFIKEVVEKVKATPVDRKACVKLSGPLLYHVINDDVRIHFLKD